MGGFIDLATFDDLQKIEDKIEDVVETIEDKIEDAIAKEKLEGKIDRGSIVVVSATTDGNVLIQ